MNEFYLELFAFLCAYCRSVEALEGLRRAHGPLGPSFRFSIDGKHMKTRREMLEGFLASDPNDSFSRYALALELEKEKHEAEAIAQLQEVIARDPEYVAAYYHLGRMLARAGQVEEARDVYTRGLDVAGRAADQKTRSEIQDALDMLS